MRKFLIVLHRVLGTALSFLLLMWFLTGFVMMYHNFPTSGTKEYRHLTALPDSLPQIDIIRKVIPQSEQIRVLNVEMFREKPVFKIETDKNSYTLSVDTTLKTISNSVPFEELESYAKKWNEAEIVKVDTLNRLDQWIPYSSYKSDFPIYKFTFNDSEKSYLYLSSVTGKALQYVNREQRFWAWVGPIPHMLYFWQWRQHRAEWITTVTFLSGFGAIMCLSGIIIGIWSYLIVYKKKKKFRTPYRKFYFKWHHIFGFVFGFFVFMFVLSGMMSFNELPQWAVKTHDNSIEKQIKESTPINLDAFKTDYRFILQNNSQKVKSISFEQFGEKAYYSTIIDSKSQNIDAQTNSLQELYLSEKDVLSRVKQISDAPSKIQLMEEFDNYYVGFTKRMQLPVYKVELEDADRSTFYIEPKTGRTRYFNKNSRAKKWIYPAFHSLRFKFFAEHKFLRDIVLWALLFGGTIVSLTGFILGIKYIGRLFRRRRKL